MAASSRGVDHKAHCQTLLVRFRVIELRELLRSIGQSTRGRKPEMMQRASDLLRDGSPRIQQKIMEIWERGHSSKRPDNYHTMAQRYSPVKGSGPATSHVKYPLPHHLTNSPPFLPFKDLKGQYVIHPDVTFKAHPFFVKKDTIIRPTALISTKITSVGSYSMRLEFHLTPHQVHRVYSSRTAKGDYNTQVVIRFCRHETSCEQEDFLPKGCLVKINGQYLQLTPVTHNRPEQMRKCKPIDITHYIKTTPAHTNDVTVIWHQDIIYPQGFVTTIELADISSSSDLLSELKNKGVRGADHTRALVKDKLSIDKDSEISATSLKVSLLCPLGKMRITNPCRASSCKHLQCFDASIYLQMNERKARWVCPVCDKPAPFEDLVIDGLFKEICESCPQNDIEFSADGSWHPFSNKPNTTNYLSTPDNKASRCSPVMIRDTPEEVERDGVQVSGGSGRGPNEPVVIDLTLSSSDEDDEPPDTRHNLHRRRSSSSSGTSSTSTSDERDDIITTSRRRIRSHSPTRIIVNLSDTPPTPISHGSVSVTRANSVSRSSTNDATDYVSSSNDSSLQQIDTNQLLINFPISALTSIPTVAQRNHNTGLSRNSGFQIFQSSSSRNSGTSLLPSVSQPPSSSSSSGQQVPVLTSRVLPMPPYSQFNPTSGNDLNSDLSFLFPVS